MIVVHFCIDCTLQISRIQNTTLYRQYVVHRDSMQRQQASAGSGQVERKLWHGTSSETLESINKTGFNRSYCGKNGTSAVWHILVLRFLL